MYYQNSSLTRFRIRLKEIRYAYLFIKLDDVCVSFQENENFCVKNKTILAQKS